jgi:hypothetical protein
MERVKEQAERARRGQPARIRMKCNAITNLTGLVDLAMDDRTASWWLGSDGFWTRHHLDDSGAPLLDIQEYLIQVKQRRTAET